MLNNLWWHTDSLGVLFMVLVFFFLDRDDLRFGRNFFLAAAACGLSTGIKYFGLYFFLAIPIYLMWGLITHRLAWKRTILYAGLFVLVMAAALVASNPLLLLPQERAEIIATQTLQFHQITYGMLLRDTQPLFTWNNYPDVFRTFYGELLFILLALGGLVYGLVKSQRRWLEALFLAWILPLTYMAEFTGTSACIICCRWWCWWWRVWRTGSIWTVGKRLLNCSPYGPGAASGRGCPTRLPC